MSGPREDSRRRLAKMPWAARGEAVAHVAQPLALGLHLAAVHFLEGAPAPGQDRQEGVDVRQGHRILLRRLLGEADHPGVVAGKTGKTPAAIEEGQGILAQVDPFQLEAVALDGEAAGRGG
jgi:hypothetical protein